MPAHGRVVEVEGEDLALAQVRLQLQRTRNLHQLAAHTARCQRAAVLGIQQAGHLHGQRRAARHNAPVSQPLPGGARQRRRVDARVPFKPTVFVIEQGHQVIRRHLLHRHRVAQRAVWAGPPAQGRCIGGQHHQRARRQRLAVPCRPRHPRRARCRWQRESQVQHQHTGQQGRSPYSPAKCTRHGDFSGCAGPPPRHRPRACPRHAHRGGTCLRQTARVRRSGPESRRATDKTGPTVGR